VVNRFYYHACIFWKEKGETIMREIEFRGKRKDTGEWLKKYLGRSKG
jgi:hypothetical protein